MVAQKRSTCLLICGWYSISATVLTPCYLQSAAKNLEVILGPFSFSSIDGIPKLDSQCFMKILVVIAALFHVVGIVLVSLE